MNKTDTIIDYVLRNPGATSATTSAALGISTPQASAMLRQLSSEGGVLSREAAGRARNNQVFYGYTVRDLNGRRCAPAKTKPAPTAQPASQPAAQPTPVYAPASAIEQAFAALADAITHQITERIMLQVEGRLAGAIHNTVATITPDAPPPSADDKESALIIGLLPQQRRLIEDEFGACFNLKFWKDEGPKRLRAAVRGADHVLLFASKAAHAHVAAVKAAGKSPITVLGGLTTLRDKLTELYAA